MQIPTTKYVADFSVVLSFYHLLPPLSCCTLSDQLTISLLVKYSPAMPRTSGTCVHRP